MNYPSKILEKAVEEISQLPGIGKRTALRLALHLLDVPKTQADNLSKSIIQLVHEIKHCKKCNNLSDTEICTICANPYRNEKIICVVEDLRDVMAIESTQQYNGKYHVLGGRISPMEGVSVTDLCINPLVERVKEQNIDEIIFALSATIEGDTTMFYLYKVLNDTQITFTTIARGIGVGDELEYTDELTLIRSLQNRVPYDQGHK
ncbi:DNA replication and repair protein RecR [Apibacter mensalis]|uniref:Recombination protein RecR n=1 Tax=Apibacter mensalis TaxID=1586267 RepID=A0A0X3ANN9_9FLAO|nr:recombination mediator RecR [Apibacter mensalis]CVK16759.1 DNA replication and repair protein RecR [Apibacter mensalis]